MYDKKLDYKELMSMTCEQLANQYHNHNILCAIKKGNIIINLCPHSKRVAMHEHPLEERLSGRHPKNLVLFAPYDLGKYKLLLIVYHGSVVPRGQLKKEHVTSSLGERWYTDDMVRTYNKIPKTKKK